MGKKSLKKDRGYITATEWRTEWGGHKDASHLPFRRLPFHCCAISFTPFDDPVCAPDGAIFDITNIVPYVQKHHKHPVSGEPLALKDLIKLHFHKNADGEYTCPVLAKVFTEHTHIVALRTSGHVYCFEAVEELNIKPRMWRDLLDDTPFTRKDILHLQDPLNLSGRTLERFDHIQKDLRSDNADGAGPDPLSSLKHMSEDMKRVVDKLNTSSATEAFAAGGGGRKAVAERLLAEAHAAAKAGAAGAPDKAGASTNGLAAQSEATAATTATGPDPRLQPPAREGRSVEFKPGASTWNTDDPSQAPPWVRAKMAKEIEEGGWRGKAKDDIGTKPSAKPVPKPYMSAKYTQDDMRTTGAASRSFTSTAVNVVTKNERTQVRVERRPKAKAYMRLHTSLGDLNLELHCDLAPRACENYLVLAEGGYYTGTAFHRSIRSFMIQGGDPTGTGTGGESIYGGTFKDELDSRLTHSGRGVLSMANSGPNTNGSQFFILFKSARHLDFKHTVFGRVVGGLEVLTAMERVETDGDDRPRTPITITGATVFVNPYKDEEAAEAAKAEQERLQAEKDAGPIRAEEKVGSWFTNPAASSNAQQNPGGVGKYLAATQPQSPRLAATADGAKVPDPSPVQPKKRQKQAVYGNFDAW